MKLIILFFATLGACSQSLVALEIDHDALFHEARENIHLKSDPITARALIKRLPVSYRICDGNWSKKKCQSLLRYMIDATLRYDERHLNKGRFCEAVLKTGTPKNTLPFTLAAGLLAATAVFLKTHGNRQEFALWAASAVALYALIFYACVGDTTDEGQQAMYDIVRDTIKRMQEQGMAIDSSTRDYIHFQCQENPMPPAIRELFSGDCCLQVLNKRQ